ncbi:hypothetical protein BKA66DRAFT_412112 [Pyrenochaeta sp. MPI-SDFR-AT-0127]|nr:hypothetical protein BKA66DRAFT_412112 [Pyrenochaeta sp. MPI-SDFR-AT-0127]
MSSSLDPECPSDPNVPIPSGCPGHAPSEQDDRVTVFTGTAPSGPDESPNSENGGAGASQSTGIEKPVPTVTTTPTTKVNLVGPSASFASSTDVAAAASPGSSSGSLSTGAVAGIAIAMLIVGGVIAFIVAFFLFKRRSRKQDTNVNAARYTSYADSTPELVMMQQKTASLGGRNSPYVQVSQTPISAPTPALIPAPAPIQQTNSYDVASFLPPAAHDETIHSRVSTLFSELQRYVETYYRDVHASITPSMEPELARFGARDVNMAELLQDCSSPPTAIKHALAAYVLGITGPKREEEGETLFPEELNGVQVRNGDEPISDTNLAAATTLHRRLSVFLYTSTHSISNPRRSWNFQSDIREAAEHFSLTFFPWASPTASDQEKEEDLARIISEALELRIWLFGQPFVYEFEWEATGRRGVLICPTLVRRPDESGEGRGRVVVEGTVVGQ